MHLPCSKSCLDILSRQKELNYILSLFLIFFLFFFLLLNQFPSSSKMKRLKSPHNQNTPELPIEIIQMIFDWLAVDSLLICKCVCKQWCSLIEDPAFIKEHTTGASPVYVRDCDIILYKNFTTIQRHPERNVDGLPRGFSMLGIFEGLVVEEIPQRTLSASAATRSLGLSKVAIFRFVH